MGKLLFGFGATILMTDKPKSIKHYKQNTVSSENLPLPFGPITTSLLTWITKGPPPQKEGKEGKDLIYLFFEKWDDALPWPYLELWIFNWKFQFILHEFELKHSKATFSLLTNLGWLRLAKVNLLSTLWFEPIRDVTFSSFNFNEHHHQQICWAQMFEKPKCKMQISNSLSMLTPT